MSDLEAKYRENAREAMRLGSMCTEPKIEAVVQLQLDAHQEGVWVAVGEAMGYGLSESARAEILMGQGMTNYCPVESPKGGEA